MPMCSFSFRLNLRCSLKERQMRFMIHSRPFVSVVWSGTKQAATCCHISFTTMDIHRPPGDSLLASGGDKRDTSNSDAPDSHANERAIKLEPDEPFASGGQLSTRKLSSYGFNYGRAPIFLAWWANLGAAVTLELGVKTLWQINKSRSVWMCLQSFGWLQRPLKSCYGQMKETASIIRRFARPTQRLKLLVSLEPADLV